MTVPSHLISDEYWFQIKESHVHLGDLLEKGCVCSPELWTVAEHLPQAYVVKGSLEIWVRNDWGRTSLGTIGTIADGIKRTTDVKAYVESLLQGLQIPPNLQHVAARP